MKKNILLLLISLVFFMAAEAHAQGWYDEDSCCSEDGCYLNETDFYAKFLSGVNFLDNHAIGKNKSSYKTGYIVAGSLGYRWCYGLRLEAEYAFRRNTIRKIHFFGEGHSKHGHFQASSYMANLLWDLPLALWGCAFWNFQPFIGVGIGYDCQRIHSSNSRVNFSQKWNHFSWQIMAGLAYPIFCDTEITLEYIFHQGGCHFYNHAIGVGLTYKLDFLYELMRS